MATKNQSPCKIFIPNKKLRINAVGNHASFPQQTRQKATKNCKAENINVDLHGAFTILNQLEKCGCSAGKDNHGCFGKHFGDDFNSAAARIVICRETCVNKSTQEVENFILELFRGSIQSEEKGKNGKETLFNYY